MLNKNSGSPAAEDFFAIGVAVGSIIGLLVGGALGAFALLGTALLS